MDTNTPCRYFAMSKTLPIDFSWLNIPMLSVLSGTNGVGKTALLHSILLTHPYSAERFAEARDVFIELTYDEKSVDDSILISNALDEILDKIEEDENSTILNSHPGSIQTKLREEYEINLQKKTQIFYYSTVSDENSFLQMNYVSIQNHREKLITCSDDLIAYARNKRKNTQQQRNDLYEHIINYFDNIRKNQQSHAAGSEDSIDRYNHELHDFYGCCCLHHVKKCTSTSDTLLFLLATTTTIDKLNEFLQQNKSNYTIVSVSHKNGPYELDARVKNRFDERITELHVLSPGEQFHFLNLLLQYEIEFSPPISPIQVHPPAILLLDEPDAHLHPSWIKDFMSCITKLVAHRKIQVIMTTHKATTIRYVPFDQCLFIMTRDANTDFVHIDQAVNKNQVVQLLTSNILQINENFRLIFVEANDDKMFYTFVQKNLYRYKYLHDAHPLLFECFGTLGKTIMYNPEVSKRESVFVDCSNRDHVIDLVRKLANSDDDELSLKNFIYGLVDGDNLTENELLENDNILTLYRYSIENYIYDPIHIFFYLLPQLDKFLKEKEDKNLEKIKNIQSSLNIRRETTIDETVKRQDASSVLQQIIDCIADLFTNTLKNILKNSNTNEKNKLLESLKDTRNDPDSDPKCNEKLRKKRDIQLLDKQDNLIDNGKSDVTIINNIESPITVQYPVLLLKINKHSIAPVYSKVHHSLQQNKLLQFIEKQMIIPKDLSEVFKKLSTANLAPSTSHQINTSPVATVKTLSTPVLTSDAKTTSGSTAQYRTSSKDSPTSDSNLPKTHVISDGYLKLVRIENITEDTRCLPLYFKWSNIPMLSIITGLNGVGKTSLLYLIFYRHPALSEIGVAKSVTVEFNSEFGVGDIFFHSESRREIPSKFLKIKSPSNELFGFNRTMLASFGNSVLLENPDDHIVFCRSDQCNTWIDYAHNPIAMFTNVKYFIKFIYEKSESGVDELNNYLGGRSFKYRILIEKGVPYYLKSTEVTQEFEQSKEEEKIPNLESHIEHFESESGLSAESFKKDLCLFLVHIIEKKTMTLEKVNAYLEKFNFSLKNIPWSKIFISFVNRMNHFDIKLGCLSPGERVTLLNLLLDFPQCTEWLQNEVKPGSILLLDEPDAHLHPSLIKDFMDYVFKLVNNYKIQVLMTTHSPETVALIPKNNKLSLCIMDFDVNTNKVKIEHAANKYQALQLLTSDVIQINDSFRVVFVESSADKLFYEYVNSYLTKNRLLSNNEQLIFRYHSPGAFKDKTDKRDKVKKIKIGHLNHVQRLVEKFTTTCGDNKPLENFIYGLVNQDYMEYIEPESRRLHCEKAYKQVKNVITINRCSSANYILDPVHVYFYALTNNKLAINDPVDIKCLSNPDCNQDYQSLQQIIQLLFPNTNANNEEIAYFQHFHLKYPVEVFNWEKEQLIKHYRESQILSHLDLKLNDVFNFLKGNGMLVPLDLYQAFEYLNAEEPRNHACHQTSVTKK